MVLPIYNSELEYNPILEELCTLNCIQQMLTYYGVKRPFKYIDTSLIIQLNKDSSESVGFSQAIHNNSIHEKYEKNLIRFYDENADPMQVYEENKKMVEANQPVIVDLDLYEMEYHKIYQLYHSRHSVILCGFENNNPIIKDEYSWNYSGSVPLEQYLKARSSLNPVGVGTFGGSPIGNGWLYIKEDGWDGDYGELLNLTLNTSLREYYENPVPMSDSQINGLNVIKELYKALVEWKEISPKERSQYVKPIRRYVLYMKSQLTMFQEYIKDANEDLKIKELVPLIDYLAEDVEQWKELGVVMVKSIYNAKLENYEKILTRMEALIQREEARYPILKKAIKAL